MGQLHYIKIQDIAPLIDPGTDEPVVAPHPEEEGKTVPVCVRWTDLVRALFADRKVLEHLDIGSMIDLRRKLLDAKGYAVTDEEEQRVLVLLAKRPARVQMDYVLGYAPMLKNIVDAPTKKPDDFEEATKPVAKDEPKAEAEEAPPAAA